MTTTPLETEGSRPPRYQTIDDEFYGPHNRDLQVRLAAQFQADALAVAARIRASRGPDSELLAMLGLDD